MSVINSDIKVLVKNRNHISRLVSGLTENQFFKILPGYKTNLLWNIGHLTSTSQILLYNLSGINAHVDEEYLSHFRKGSSPENWVKPPEVKEVLRLFLDLGDQVKVDYESDLFSNFKSYTTSIGVTLENIQDALAFNNYHDGMHTGIIQCMLKSL